MGKICGLDWYEGFLVVEIAALRKDERFRFSRHQWHDLTTVYLLDILDVCSVLAWRISVSIGLWRKMKNSKDMDHSVKFIS